MCKTYIKIRNKSKDIIYLINIFKSFLYFPIYVKKSVKMKFIIATFFAIVYTKSFGNKLINNRNCIIFTRKI